MIKRNTKQKSLIKEYLMGRKDHPTAEMVYEGVRQSLPKISLGTVYRNLQAMSKDGEIRKVRVDDGADHFDARKDDHYHFICKECGGVMDLDGAVRTVKVEHSDFEGEIQGHSIYFYGVCPICIRT